MERDKNVLSIQPNTDRVLMSDVLRGQVPELDEDVVDDPFRGKHVVLTADVHVGSTSSMLAGILRGIGLGTNPEIEFRTDLRDAMDLMKAPGLSFGKFELEHGEQTVEIPGPFIVKEFRLTDISAQDQLCTVGLSLVKQQR